MLSEAYARHGRDLYMQVNGVDQINQAKYKKPGFWRCAAGVLAGSAVSGLVSVPVKLINPIIMNKIKEMHNLSADELVRTTEGIEKTLSESGLKGKGVEIIRATPENIDRIKILIQEEFNAGLGKYLIPKDIRNFMAILKSYAVKAGQNAFCLFESNKILLPEKNLALAAFHEMGHAANANLSTIGKLLQKCRPLTALAIPVALISLYKTAKAPGERPKGTFDKITNFVKRHAGVLTFITFVPSLAEESMASIKGNAFAKKVLSPELVAKVAKGNKLAFITYTGLTLGASIGLYLGVKVKDSIAKPKLVQKNN